jgi:hypothetical protein
MTRTARTSNDSLSVFLGVASAVALSSAWFLYRRYSSNRKAGDRRQPQLPPLAPASILECVNASGPRACSFVQEMADATGSFIYRLRLPIPGGAVVVGDPLVQREILLGAYVT